jgi:N-methylhydantoinase A
MQNYAVGIDVGGTFTDFVAIDSSGRTLIAKVPTTPDDQSLAVIEGLQKLASTEHTTLDQFLSNCDYIVHGTTVATNMMLEYKGAATGIITTRGFRDIIDIRRNYKEADFDIRVTAPYPIVPRRRRIGVTERVDSSGDVVIPLNEDEVRQAVDLLRGQAVQSIAVCYLFAFLNPRHEIRTGEIIREIDPSLHVSLSHQVLPRVREFERLSATVIDSYITPGVSRYLSNLESTLRELGYSGEIFTMAANGGMLPIDQACRQGVQLVLSGPAGGVVAGSRIGEAVDWPDVITVDMGGTSYDVCLIKSGQPSVGIDAWINRYRVAIPTLDMHTIGAGGGSIASVDVAGRLSVGPDSAGARPGPACYGRGGHLPTVTDADLYLGLIGANSFLGGAIKLDVEGAERAIHDRIAEPLGMRTVDAAAGIFRVVNNNMTNGIRAVSMTKGYDPRDFALIAFGGAGPVHAVPQAMDLGIRRILIPRGQASVLAAWGDVMSDVRVSKSRGYYGRSSSIDLDELNRLIADAISEARAEISHVKSITEMRVEASFEVHYRQQTHEILVPAVLEPDFSMSEASLRATFERFHALHEQMYSFKKPAEEMEILGIQVTLWGIRPKPSAGAMEQVNAGASSTTAEKGTRQVYFEAHRGFVETPVFDGLLIAPGVRVDGPAIVEEPNTTIVVYPGSRLSTLGSAAGEMYELVIAS